LELWKKVCVLLLLNFYFQNKTVVVCKRNKFLNQLNKSAPAYYSGPVIGGF
jgi:hypothetical protein